MKRKVLKEVNVSIEDVEKKLTPELLTKFNKIPQLIGHFVIPEYKIDRIKSYHRDPDKELIFKKVLPYFEKAAKKAGWEKDWISKGYDSFFDYMKDWDKSAPSSYQDMKKNPSKYHDGHLRSEIVKEEIVYQVLGDDTSLEVLHLLYEYMSAVSAFSGKGYDHFNKGRYVQGGGGGIGGPKNLARFFNRLGISRKGTVYDSQVTNTPLKNTNLIQKYNKILKMIGTSKLGSLQQFRGLNNLPAKILLAMVEPNSTWELNPFGGTIASASVKESISFGYSHRPENYGICYYISNPNRIGAPIRHMSVNSAEEEEFIAGKLVINDIIGITRQDGKVILKNPSYEKVIKFIEDLENKVKSLEDYDAQSISLSVRCVLLSNNNKQIFGENQS